MKPQSLFCMASAENTGSDMKVSNDPEVLDWSWGGLDVGGFDWKRLRGTWSSFHVVLDEALTCNASSVICHFY